MFQSHILVYKEKRLQNHNIKNMQKGTKFTVFYVPFNKIDLSHYIW